MSGKVVQITSREPWGAEMIPPHERLAQRTADALDDLALAVWTATTRGELGFLRTLTRTLAAKLEAIECTATTLDEYHDELKQGRR